MWVRNKTGDRVEIPDNQWWENQRADPGIPYIILVLNPDDMHYYPETLPTMPLGLNKKPVGEFK